MARVGVERIGQVHRFFHQAPVGGAAGAVQGDADLEFLVGVRRVLVRGGNVGDRAAGDGGMVGGELFGVMALAGTRAAQHQGELAVTVSAGGTRLGGGVGGGGGCDGRGFHPRIVAAASGHRTGGVAGTGAIIRQCRPTPRNPCRRVPCAAR
ncbi:hypothetical protein D9M72_531230 [compost metagenome]